MPRTPDGTSTIRWMTGFTHIRHETRVKGNALVFGYRINDGEFKPTCRMICDDPKDLALASSIAVGV